MSLVIPNQVLQVANLSAEELMQDIAVMLFERERLTGTTHKKTQYCKTNTGKYLDWSNLEDWTNLTPLDYRTTKPVS